MAKATTDYKKRAIKNLIRMMEESGRPSVTLGRADINIVLPILKEHVGQ